MADPNSRGRFSHTRVKLQASHLVGSAIALVLSSSHYTASLCESPCRHCHCILRMQIFASGAFSVITSLSASFPRHCLLTQTAHNHPPLTKCECIPLSIAIFSVDAALTRLCSSSMEGQTKDTGDVNLTARLHPVWFHASW
jgi:hypothetical protein